jgi:glycosyltransferase involved in cell wall biosynthesis
MAQERRVKKVLIVSNIVWTIANFRKSLITALKKEGYEVVCVSAPDEFSEISDRILEELGARSLHVPLDRKGANPLKDVLYFFRLLRTYGKEKPDVVLHFTVKPNIYGTLAAKMAGVPSINTVNGLGSAFIADNFLSRMLQSLYRFSFGFSRRIFFQNAEDMAFFLDHGLADRGKCAIVPGSGIDTRIFAGCGKSGRSGVVFLMVARLLRDKGVYEYIAACRRLRTENPDIRCLLAGVLDEDNPSAVSKDELEKWVSEGVVEYLGKTDRIKEFYGQADVVVLPSYREGLSRVLLEAASCEKPLIATDVPGCRELVLDGKSGLLCRPKDADDLHRAMAAMASRREEFRDMGKNGREHIVKRYSHDRVNAIYLQAIREIFS